jgi:DNA-binding response OmpR family regulator/glycine cleavage system H lipoate-binding protein
MSDNPKLLVVDDEEVICQACRRIFSPQGFQVEVNTDAGEGLNWATQRDYGAILLDIKMPKMDGIQFLERLREKKPDVPVLIMTGYPSVPNAAAAIRLGAADYVTKPFTPEEITRAVHRIVAVRREADLAAAPGSGPAPAEAEPGGEGILFHGEAWFRLEQDGSACVGVVLPGLREGAVRGIRLPRIGEVVYQGLPMAGVSLAEKPVVVVPAPVSGVIAAVNESLLRNAAPLIGDPCGEGWLACICTTRYEDELVNCKARRAILASGDAASAAEQQRKLAALGCQVRVVTGIQELAESIQGPDGQVVMLDAASLGDQGPEMAAQVGARSPATRVVVLAPPGDQRETAYRKTRIFYYAVAPFADNEIADILDAAFRGQEQHPSKPERHKGPSESISSISITNRNGHRVQLLAAPGLLWRQEGLGGQISEKLLDQAFPVVMTPGEASLAPANILKLASACDRLMVLMAKDSDALPGNLVRDTKPDFSVSPGEVAGRVTILNVQPDALGGLAALDARTIGALADHIVREMASY